MEKKVIAYVRVSTDAQAKEDRFGIEAQEKMIRKYCAEHGYNLGPEDWVYDRGESGAKERPGFDRIVYGDVSNPPVEAVIVAKSDRVARDINVYFYYKMLLKKKEIELVSISEDFGNMGVFAPMLEAFTICVAQMERDNINKRTSAGRDIKAAQGGYSGGRAPMGYRVENGRLVVDEDEAEIVRFIFRRKAAGCSKMSTVTALNEAGFRTRGGKMFMISTVQSIWNNGKTYRGMYHYGKDGKWVKGQHEPILTDEFLEELGVSEEAIIK